MNIKTGRRPTGGRFTAFCRGVAVGALLALWGVGAVLTLLFGKLENLGIALADLAADGIDAVRCR